ncbi:MAG: hypothetical protein ACK5LV_07095 [Lachnospirales bacterium]
MKIQEFITFVKALDDASLVQIYNDYSISTYRITHNFNKSYNANDEFSLDDKLNNLQYLFTKEKLDIIENEVRIRKLNV